MNLPVDSIIAGQKLTQYLLKWRPEDDKSAFLGSAGYTLLNAAVLESDLRRQVLPLDAELVEATEYGPKFLIKAPLRGPNGRTLQVVTIWMTEEATQQTKFITLYPVR